MDEHGSGVRSRNRQPVGPRTERLPFVTIIMPIRNEQAFIERSLGAVLAQDYPSERMEVIVVDGISDDGTREIVQRMIDDRGEAPDDKLSSVAPPPSSILVLDNPSHIVSAGFNTGLRYAQGDIIVRVDGHCEIAPNYARRCVQLLRETGAQNVGGLQRSVGHGWVGHAIALATSSPFGVGNAQFHYADEPGWVDTVYLGAYRREVFARIGGFDEELVRNQDDEFNFRLIQAGGRVWLDPSIHSVYYGQARLRGLWHQYFQYGCYKVRVIQKRGAVSSWRHLVPGAFALAILGSLLVALLTHQGAWILSVAAPYGVTTLLASLWTARRDSSTLPVLPIVFTTMHVSYGVGFLWGLWRFRKCGFRMSELPRHV